MLACTVISTLDVNALNLTSVSLMISHCTSSSEATNETRQLAGDGLVRLKANYCKLQIQEPGLM